MPWLSVQDVYFWRLGQTGYNQMKVIDNTLDFSKSVLKVIALFLLHVLKERFVITPFTS